MANQNVNNQNQGTNQARPIQPGQAGQSQPREGFNKDSAKTTEKPARETDMSDDA